MFKLEILLIAGAHKLSIVEHFPTITYQQFNIYLAHFLQFDPIGTKMALFYI